MFKMIMLLTWLTISASLMVRASPTPMEPYPYQDTPRMTREQQEMFLRRQAGMSSHSNSYYGQPQTLIDYYASGSRSSHRSGATYERQQTQSYYSNQGEYGVGNDAIQYYYQDQGGHPIMYNQTATQGYPNMHTKAPSKKLQVDEDDRDPIWGKISNAEKTMLLRILRERVKLFKETKTLGHLTAVMTRNLADMLDSRDEGTIKRAIREIYKRQGLPQPLIVSKEKKPDELDSDDDEVIRWKYLPKDEKILILRVMEERFSDLSEPHRRQLARDTMTNKKAKQLRSKQEEDIMEAANAIRIQYKPPGKRGNPGLIDDNLDEEEGENIFVYRGNAILSPNDKMWPHISTRVRNQVIATIGTVVKRKDRTIQNVARDKLTKGMFDQLGMRGRENIEAVAKQLWPKEPMERLTRAMGNHGLEDDDVGEQMEVGNSYSEVTGYSSEDGSGSYNQDPLSNSAGYTPYQGYSSNAVYQDPNVGQYRGSASNQSQASNAYVSRIFVGGPRHASDDVHPVWDDIDQPEKSIIINVLMERVLEHVRSTVNRALQAGLTRRLADSLQSLDESTVQNAINTLYSRSGVTQPVTIEIQNRSNDRDPSDDVQNIWSVLDVHEKTLLANIMSTVMPVINRKPILNLIELTITGRKEHLLRSRDQASIQTTVESMKREGKARKKKAVLQAKMNRAAQKQAGKGQRGREEEYEEEEEDEEEEDGELDYRGPFLSDDTLMLPHLNGKQQENVFQLIKAWRRRSTDEVIEMMQTRLTKSIFDQIITGLESQLGSAIYRMTKKRKLGEPPWMDGVTAKDANRILEKVGAMFKKDVKEVRLLFEQNNVSAQQAVDLLYAASPQEVESILFWEE